MIDRHATPEPMTNRALRTPADLDKLDFAKHSGLVPVVVQAAGSGHVLMVAWATREALELSLTNGEMHFWSRSRSTLWRKGATSGNVLRVVSLHADCDGDTVLARVRPSGPACHTGDATCFGELEAVDVYDAVAAPVGGGTPTPARPPSSSAPGTVLSQLDVVLAARQAERPEGSYTVRLLDDENLRLKKLGEETAELVAELVRRDGRRIAEEAADLLYHLMVALRGSGVTLDEVMARLAKRRR
jgi:phosphoribosyl-ATP pyrophosphohydrolase/phosphoribosyl-AMP cyclohydrolase